MGNAVSHKAAQAFRLIVECMLLAFASYGVLSLYALGSISLVRGVTMPDVPLLPSVVLYFTFTALALPLSRWLRGWWWGWFAPGVTEWSFAAKNARAIMRVLMKLLPPRYLPAIASTSTAILAAGLSETSIQWLMVALGSGAVWLLLILAEHERKAEHQVLQEQARDDTFNQVLALAGVDEQSETQHREFPDRG